MKSFMAVVEKCAETGLYVGYVPSFPGAHSQAETLDELNANLREVVEMLLEDGEPSAESEFVGTQHVLVSKSRWVIFQSFLPRKWCVYFADLASS